MLCVGLLFTPGEAQDWPMFRGPQASGVADGRALPTEWDAVRGSNLQWKITIPGLAHSSPIVWENLVFITTAIDPNSKTPFSPTNPASMEDATPMSWHLYCLDKHSGKILWQRTAHQGVPRSKRHPKASQANQTPVTDGKYVAALLGSEGLYVYDLNSARAFPGSTPRIQRASDKLYLHRRDRLLGNHDNDAVIADFDRQ
jgi:hypothetical protein